MLALATAVTLSFLPLLAFAITSASSPGSKKIVLQSRKISPGTLRRRSLQSYNVPLRDYFNQTDLQ